MKIHKFQLNGMYIMLDINSGVVHIIDEMIDKIMDIYNGSNKAEVIDALSTFYPESELNEALLELDELIDNKDLFAEDLSVPPTFSEEPLVKSLCLHVAHDCNLRCQYCFASTGDFGLDRSMMTTDIGEKAVDFIIANSGNRTNCEMDFFGGEPLMNMPVVKHVVSYIRKREIESGKKFKLTLTTNGVLLNDDNINYLKDNDISLVLSLDGRKEVHDKMRPNMAGQGSYEKSLANFKQAVAANNGQNYVLRGTFTAYNLDFMADVLDMVDKGFANVSVEPVVSKDVPYALEQEHLPQLFAEYEKLAIEFINRKNTDKDFAFFHFNMDIHNGPCIAKRLSGCGAGHEYFAVAPNGDLYPCHQFVGRENYLMGNIFDGVKKKEVSADFRNAHVLNKEECSKCWARFFCSGGCHANADLFNNNIYQPYEIGCELQKKRLECALMIQAQLAIVD